MHPQRTPRRKPPAEQLALGRAVRWRRALDGMSQEELGRRSALHRNYIGAVERGEINPTFRTLRTLAEGLDVELSSLIRLYEEREEDRAA